MCRGPLAYGHATAVNTRALMRPTLTAGSSGVQRVYRVPNRREGKREQVNEAALVTTLSELLAIPSIGGTPAEAEIQQLLAEWLTGLGLAVDLWPIDLPDLRTGADFPGEEVDRTQAWGLVATHRPDEPSGLVLQD
jgi:hypothetical protein